MLAPIFRRGYRSFLNNRLGSCVYRNFKNDNHPLLPGGGLGKLQGGIKEETYFNSNDLKLITKMHEQPGSKLKCEDCLDNWSEFEKILTVSEKPEAAQRDTCFMNKHKNCLEEAFFLSLQIDNVKLMQKKLKNENLKTAQENKSSFSSTTSDEESH